MNNSLKQIEEQALNLSPEGRMGGYLIRCTT